MNQGIQEAFCKLMHCLWVVQVSSFHYWVYALTSLCWLDCSAKNFFQGWRYPQTSIIVQCMHCHSIMQAEFITHCCPFCFKLLWIQWMVDHRYQFVLQFRILIIHLVQLISIFLEHVPPAEPMKCLWEQGSYGIFHCIVLICMNI
jgi:hypothetical protein